MKFRRKPSAVTIEATKFDPKRPHPSAIQFEDRDGKKWFGIEVKGKIQVLTEGDWIVEGVDGPYPVDNETFYRLWEHYDDFAETMIRNQEIG